MTTCCVESRDKLGFALSAGREADPKVVAAIYELRSAPGVDVLARLDMAFGTLNQRVVKSAASPLYKQAYEGIGGMAMKDNGQPAFPSERQDRQDGQHGHNGVVSRPLHHNPNSLQHLTLRHSANRVNGQAGQFKTADASSQLYGSSGLNPTMAQQPQPRDRPKAPQLGSNLLAIRQAVPADASGAENKYALDQRVVKSSRLVTLDEIDAAYRRYIRASNKLLKSAQTPMQPTDINRGWGGTSWGMSNTPAPVQAAGTSKPAPTMPGAVKGPGTAMIGGAPENLAATTDPAYFTNRFAQPGMNKPIGGLAGAKPAPTAPVAQAAPIQPRPAPQPVKPAPVAPTAAAPKPAPAAAPAPMKKLGGDTVSLGMLPPLSQGHSSSEAIPERVPNAEYKHMPVGGSTGSGAVSHSRIGDIGSFFDWKRKQLAALGPAMAREQQAWASKFGPKPGVLPITKLGISPDLVGRALNARLQQPQSYLSNVFDKYRKHAVSKYYAPKSQPAADLDKWLQLMKSTPKMAADWAESEAYRAINEDRAPLPKKITPVTPHDVIAGVNNAMGAVPPAPKPEPTRATGVENLGQVVTDLSPSLPSEHFGPPRPYERHDHLDAMLPGMVAAPFLTIGGATLGGIGGSVLGGQRGAEIGTSTGTLGGLGAGFGASGGAALGSLAYEAARNRLNVGFNPNLQRRLISSGAALGGIAGGALGGISGYKLQKEVHRQQAVAKKKREIARQKKNAREAEITAALRSIGHKTAAAPIGPPLSPMKTLIGTQSPTAKITPPEPPKKAQKPQAPSVTPMQTGAGANSIVPKMASDVDMGDMICKDSGNLGRDFIHKANGKKIAFFNQAAELALQEDLANKYPHGRDSSNVLLGLKKRAYEDHSRTNTLRRKAVVPKQLPVHPQPDPHIGNEVRVVAKQGSVINYSKQASTSPYGEDCPVCGSPAVSRCRCRIGNMSCENKHDWHKCAVHNKTCLGTGHCSSADGCTCNTKQADGMAGPGQCHPKPIGGAYKCPRCGCTWHNDTCAHCGGKNVKQASNLYSSANAEVHVKAERAKKYLKVAQMGMAQSGPAYNTTKIQFPSIGMNKGPFQMSDRFNRDRSDMGDWMKQGVEDLALAAARKGFFEFLKAAVGAGSTVGQEGDRSVAFDFDPGNMASGENLLRGANRIGQATGMGGDPSLTNASAEQAAPTSQERQGALQRANVDPQEITRKKQDIASRGAMSDAEAAKNPHMAALQKRQQERNKATKQQTSGVMGPYTSDLGADDPRSPQWKAYNDPNDPNYQKLQQMQASGQIHDPRIAAQQASPQQAVGSGGSTAPATSEAQPAAPQSATAQPQQPQQGADNAAAWKALGVAPQHIQAYEQAGVTPQMLQTYKEHGGRGNILNWTKSWNRTGQAADQAAQARQQQGYKSPQELYGGKTPANAIAQSQPKPAAQPAATTQAAPQPAGPPQAGASPAPAAPQVAGPPNIPQQAGPPVAGAGANPQQMMQSGAPVTQIAEQMRQPQGPPQAGAGPAGSAITQPQYDQKPQLAGAAPQQPANITAVTGGTPPIAPGSQPAAAAPTPVRTKPQGGLNQGALSGAKKMAPGKPGGGAGKTGDNSLMS